MSSLLFDPFQPIAAIATNPTAAKHLSPLCQRLGITLWGSPLLQHLEGVTVYPGSIQAHIDFLWSSHRAIIFGLATGAVVRLIAPLLQDKAIDPAVVVVDASGKFVISLCSGHEGKADQLTQLIASQLNATPVITGASSSLGLPGIDILGIPYGWRKGSGDWLGVSAAIAAGESVEVIQEVGFTRWQDSLPDNHPFEFGLSDDPTEDDSFPPEARVWISFTQRQFSPDSDIPKVQWHPRVLWVGMGCERGTSLTLIKTALDQVFSQYHLAQGAIAGIATIDLKADEDGILTFCEESDLPLKTFSAEQLRNISVPTPSTVVNAEVGTPSVAEASALLASGNTHPLLVPKQIVKLEGQSGAVTIAVAQSDLEYTGRTGELWLVGTGPGELDQITPAAQSAINQADAIVGYSLYIDLIRPLCRPGQVIEALPITQERQRAQRAIELAQWGLNVAVVSSGDCGIYGMAGLVLEELRAQNWDGKTPQVQVFPGISALQAAASRVGTPLMHDFCAISLSDLLTPWEVIEKRLEAAAKADFVISLYNPRSQTRTQQIITAQQIFLQYRDRNTPVAIVHSAYRDDEETLTTLEKMLESPIDMLTTVIIGNSSTRNYSDWIITPRGYLKDQE
ncbi:MAG: precorrin-3B C(17)-methyltransferase [Chroococcales cyanobacterium]